MDIKSGYCDEQIRNEGKKIYMLQEENGREDCVYHGYADVLYVKHYTRRGTLVELDVNVDLIWKLTGKIFSVEI